MSVTRGPRSSLRCPCRVRLDTLGSPSVRQLLRARASSDHPGADYDRDARRRRADPHRQGRRRPRERAAADARGRRLGRRVRRRRRDDRCSACAASACAVLAGSSARSTSRGCVAPPGRVGADDGGDRARDPARLAGPGLLPAAARGPRRPALHDAQVPLDGGRRRAQKARCSHQRDRTGCSRSTTTRGSPASAASCAARRSTSCRS